MRRPILLLGLVLIASCSQPSNPKPAAATAAVSPAASTATVAPPGTPVAEAFSMPPQACTREGYESFFEAFVGNEATRSSHSAPGVDPAGFGIELRDSTWIDPAAPDVPLDVKEARDGDEFTVDAVPVERDANDEIVRTLGPAARYRFRYVEGCWQYVGRN